MPTAVDQLDVDTWDETQEDDDYLPTNDTVLYDLTQQRDNDNDDSTHATEADAANIEEANAAEIEEATFGSIYFNGQRQSTRNHILMRKSNINFDNKSYTNVHYKDRTIHITIPSCHDANQPSPTNTDQLMHVLGVALLHYYTSEIRAAAFAQSYSLKAGLRKFGNTGKIAAINELKQIHNQPQNVPPSRCSLVTCSPQTKRNKPSICS